MAGAPKGNDNAAKGREWRDAIRYELAAIGRGLDGDDPAYIKGLRECARQFIAAAQSGEQWAIKELGDRTDGKPVQPIAGDDDNPLFPTEVRVRVVKPDP